MRIVSLGLSFAALALPAWAGEPVPPPAPKAEKAVVPAIVPQSIELPRPATAIARGREGEEILVSTEDGAVVRLVIGRSPTWRATTSGEPADLLAAASNSDFVAAATPREVHVFGAQGGAVCWRVPRPVVFAFDATGQHLVSLTKEGEVVERDAATGKELARRKFADGRRVVKASLHAASGLAVLGVADG